MAGALYAVFHQPRVNSEENPRFVVERSIQTNPSVVLHDQSVPAQTLTEYSDAQTQAVFLEDVPISDASDRSENSEPPHNGGVPEEVINAWQGSPPDPEVPPHQPSGICFIRHGHSTIPVPPSDRTLNQDLLVTTSRPTFKVHLCFTL
ncbi:unnamed protein product [Protopolystoma xenopodis]|uniref:Uncharacterized protein n=1 Tax=Protopolystoma xenopodis TaxID=117903 RepID=A0A3S4ZPQ5_9PLAT|nr:unnamed protein product [Protopolystoma xenopodis]